MRRVPHAAGALLGLALVADVLFAQPLNPTGRQLELQTPVEANAVAIGSLLVRLSIDDTVSVEAESLLPLLAERVRPTLLDALAGQVREARLTLEDIVAAGIGASFDPARLTLVLDIPESERRVETISLRPALQRQRITARPEPLSAFVNVNAGWTFTEIRAEEADGTDVSEGTVAGTLAGLARLGGPVLAYEASFREGADGDPALRRDGTRLLVDLPRVESRLSLGDVSVNGRLFQAPLDLLGIGLGREFTLSPGRNVRPTGRQEFSLDRPSTVELVDGERTIRRLQLGPGRYDLQDLPLDPGPNAIEIRITDDSGQIETLLFNAVYDTALLAPGEIDFGFVAGVLTERGGETLDYRDDVAAVSGFVSAGLGQSLTGGLNMQLAPDAGQFGLELLRATAIGPVGLALGASRSDERGSGQAIALGYTSVSRGASARRFGIDVQYRSEGFDEVDPNEANADASPLGDGQGLRPQLTLNAVYSQRLGRSLFGSLSLGRTTRHDTDAVSESASVGLSGRLGAAGRLSWGVRASYVRNEEEDNEDTYSLDLGITYRLGRTDALLARASSEDAGIDLGFSRQVDIVRPGGYSVDVLIAGDEEDDLGLEGSFAYTGNRFRARLENDLLVPDVEGEAGRNVTAAFVETSLAVAGRSVAFGRAIGTSFAILHAHPTLGERVIRVDPDNEGELSRSSGFGGAVLPNLGTYNVRSVDYTVDDLPLGYDLGDGVFVLQPPLGAGYRLEVGSAATVTVIGVLVDEASGEPLPLVAGKALPRDDPLAEPVVFFSNRTGKFAISGLSPGLHDLEIATRPPRRVELEVPDDGQTLLRLERLAVP